MAGRASWRALDSAAAALLTCCCVLLAAQRVAADGYSYGRATFYDDNGQGSCHYYHNIATQYYAAWPDSQGGFSGSCGKCFEVSCVRRDFRDGYGQFLHRQPSCYDESRRVVVKIVDSCPCVHANAYSNRRWCCGDMPHIDLSRAAFQHLADEHWGVIGLRWKPASCDKLGPQ